MTEDDVAARKMETISPSVRRQVGDESAQASLQEFLLYFLYLGTLGFGGPIALAGHMQKDLVEERKWVSSGDYAEGLAFSQLSPVPSRPNLRCISAGCVLGRLVQR